nr:protocadherin cluster 1 gamma 26a [Danio rerio]
MGKYIEKMEIRWNRRSKRAALWLLSVFLMWSTVGALTRYTIPEELQEGSVVGNIAKDLGFVVSDIANRNLRVVSENSGQYFSVGSERAKAT